MNETTNFQFLLLQFQLLRCQGTSMGAATSILCASETQDNPGSIPIDVMVCDSSFSDMLTYIGGSGQMGFKVPKFVISLLLTSIDEGLHQLVGAGIDELSPISHVSKLKMPALFLHGMDDDFIPLDHTESLCDRYGQAAVDKKGRPPTKSLLFVEGTHGSKRPSSCVSTACEFLVKNIKSRALQGEVLNVEWEYISSITPPWLQ